MRRLASLLLAAGAVGATAAPAAAAPYVVTYAPGVTDAAPTTTALSKKLAFSTRHRYSTAVRGFAAELSSGQVAALRRAPEVAAVQPDAEFSAAGAPIAAGEALPPGVRRIEAATTTTAAGTANHAVAVLDTGIDPTHPDLAVSHGTNCIRPGTPATDDNGHGTHVAGVVGARNQGSGLLGVAPGTRLVAVKVLSSTSRGTLSQILCGLDWLARNAAAQNIKVATMSLAGAGSSDGACGAVKGDAYHKAVCAVTSAGVAIVAAAGNGGADFARTIPAAYPEVLTATAMSDTDGVAGGLGPVPSCSKGAKDDVHLAASNFAVAEAERRHAIAAPGTCVRSTARGGGTAVFTGTSQAAPHVAGALALCFGSGGVAGPCAGLTAKGALTRVRDDALAAQTPANGFLGDPLRPVSGRFFGPLVRARY